MSNKYPYDIAISFAGEDRSIASQIAAQLKEGGVSVFYDEYETGTLWGKNLYDHLENIYAEQAKFCLMLISKHYANKSWTNQERKNAQARAFRQNEEYILPLRLDDTKIPGLSDTVAYIRFEDYSIEEIANLLLEKLDSANTRFQSSPPENKQGVSDPFKNIPMPNVQKSYSEKDKDNFLQKSFSFIKNYFSRGLSQLEERFQEIDTDLIEINNLRFAARIYRNGEKINQCVIWIGGFGGFDQILYLEGSNINIHSDNSHNEYISVAEYENELRLNYSNMGFSNVNEDTSHISSEKCAQFLWTRFTNHLEL